MDKWLKLKKACEALKFKGYSISERTLRDYVRDNRIRHTKPAKFILFKEQWLDEFLEGRYKPDEKLDN